MLRTTLLAMGIVFQLFGLLVQGSVAAEPEVADESKLTDTQKVDLYISQLMNLECQEVYTTEGRYINPYVAKVAGEFVEDTPTRKLRAMGMAAVPALVKVLDDDTPTKTIFDWGKGKHVWRVSDFAWVLLQGILSRDFITSKVIIHGPFSLTPKQRKQVFQEIKDWHADSKGLTRNELRLTYFASTDPADWYTAGEYFAKRQDKQAVEPLLEKIRAGEFPIYSVGAFCQLVARFNDPRAIDVIKQVMETAEDPTDRVRAAFAMGTLGDNSGVPTVIQYLSEEKTTLRIRDDCVWFLMRDPTKNGIAALAVMLSQVDANRAGETLESVTNSIAGSFGYQAKESAGTAEILPLLVEALNRSNVTSYQYRFVKLRVKDHAALAILRLKDGTSAAFYRDAPQGSHFAAKKLLSVQQRDQQIEQLKTWYAEHEGKLDWDAEQKKLVLKRD